MLKKVANHNHEMNWGVRVWGGGKGYMKKGRTIGGSPTICMIDSPRIYHLFIG